MREQVEGVAAETQTPTDLAAMLALAMLATATQRRYVVEVRANYREHLCIWALVLMDSAERKSPVFTRMRAPVFQRQAELLAAAMPDRARRDSALKAAEKSVTKAIDRVATTRASGKSDDATAAACKLDEATDEVTRIRGEMPPFPTLLVDDITPERLAQVMADNGGAVTIASSEGGVFDTFSGRYTKGQVPNIDLLLKSYSGDPAVIDRVGSGRFAIEDPCLTFGMAVQPDVMVDLWENKAMRNRGGIARFVIAMPRSRVGTRVGPGAAAPARVTQAYIDGMLDLLPKTPPVTRADQPAESIVIKLDREASEVWEGFAAALEIRMHPETGDLARHKEWCGKLAGTLARGAAILQFAEDGESCRRVTGPTMRKALELAPYLIAHATAALDGESQEARDAHVLRRWIITAQPETFTERDVYRDKFGRDTKDAKARSEAACRYLEDHDLIRELPSSRVDSRIWQPHPTLLGVSEVSDISGIYNKGVQKDSLSISGSVKPNHENASPGTTQNPTSRKPPTLPTLDAAERHRQQGIACGYPECCIEAFVADIEAGRQPARERGTTTNAEYVPCSACQEEFSAAAPPGFADDADDTYDPAVGVTAAVIAADPGDPFDPDEWAQHAIEHDGSPRGQWASPPAGGRA